MHGLGNDFVVINSITQEFTPTTEQCRTIADRRFGIGCDQVLLIQKPLNQDMDFQYRIFNQDGTEVEQCGNGARCVAKFVRDQGLTTKDEIAIETLAGPVRLFMDPDGQVRVNMGQPHLKPQDVPFVAGQLRLRYPLTIDGEIIEIGVASMGNPHAVIQVNDIEQAPVKRMGPRIETHSRFPKNTNVGFMQVISRQHIRLRVHERGVGETLACGTGACAAAVVGNHQGLLDSTVRVQLPGGDLKIEWAGAGQPVWMTGPAVLVFNGEIEI